MFSLPLTFKDHYYDIDDLRHYNPFDMGHLMLDLKKIKDHPIQSKLETTLYVEILERYEPILEMLVYHLRYMLKTQFLDILGYDGTGKSRSNGYKIVKELEKKGLISTEIYNGSQYIFASYRSYYYFGINKKSVERKPSERALNRYFMFAEFYIKLHESNRDRNSCFILFCSNEKSTIDSEAFSEIGNCPQNKTYIIAQFVDDMEKRRNFDKHNRLSQLLPNAYMVDELDQVERGKYFSLFMENIINYFNNKCIIDCYMNDDKYICFFFRIIHVANNSWRTYDQLFVNLNRLILSTKLFYNVKFKIIILTSSKNDIIEAKQVINNTIRKRQGMKTPKLNRTFYKFYTEAFKNRINYINLNISRRIPNNNEYTSNRNKPYRI